MNLSNNNYEKSFWYYDPENNFPPTSEFDISDTYSSLRLSLAGTKESSLLSDYKQKKIIKGWEKILPSLKVEFLWIAPKVSQSLFEAISQMPNLKGLCLQHSNITSFPKSGFEKLEFLNLGNSPKLKCLTDISRLDKLKWLDTENLKQINDFSFISKLTDLIGLSIDGGMYSTQFLNSLTPLKNLSNLHYLSLCNTRVEDKDLSPLGHLKKLKTLHIAKWWSKEDFENLQNQLPNLKIK